MSHFSAIKTTLKEPALIAALRSLNLNPQISEEAATCRNRYGSSRDALAHIIVPMEEIGPRSQADLGFIRQPDGSLEMIVDWWDVEHARPRNFRNEFFEAYAVQNVLALGQYKIVDRIENKDGTIQLVLEELSAIDVGTDQLQVSI